MNIVVDAGNTRLKYGVFRDGTLVSHGVGETELLSAAMKASKAGELNVLLSCSGKLCTKVRDMLRKLAHRCVEASADMPVPIHLGYDEPERMGMDRLADCVGACHRHPGERMLIIDMGTCNTYNYVENDTFYGGDIAPGVRIRLKAMHIFTAKLPQVREEGELTECGQTTDEAIRNGVIKGTVFEVGGYVQEFFKRNAEGRVVITGGSSWTVKELLNERVEQVETLGLEGLNEILIGARD